MDELRELFAASDRQFRLAGWIEEQIRKGVPQREIAWAVTEQAAHADPNSTFSEASVSAHHRAWQAIVDSALIPSIELFDVAFRVTSTGRTATGRKRVVAEVAALPYAERYDAFITGMEHVLAAAVGPNQTLESDELVETAVEALTRLRGVELTTRQMARLSAAIGGMSF